MTTTTIEMLRGYFKTELPAAGELSDGQSLLDTGLLDSLAIVKLIAYLEDEFGVELSDDEFEPDNFESLTMIAKLVDDKRAS